MSTDLENDFDYSLHDASGTPDSHLLKEIRDAGFKPIGITVMMCEETFIFKNKIEANLAAEKFMPEGWWYGIDEWIETRIEYVKENYGGDEELAPTIYWFDNNFAPKEER